MSVSLRYNRLMVAMLIWLLVMLCMPYSASYSYKSSTLLSRSKQYFPQSNREILNKKRNFDISMTGADFTEITSNAIIPWINSFPVASDLITANDVQTGGAFVPGYSNVSLYFTLFLYVLSLPGLFSLVTRSVKVKNVQKYYDIPGPANPTAKQLRQVAGEIMAYFKALNYAVEAAEETITFKGVMGKSNSQAAFLTFCTFMGLGSLGLVLSVIFPDLGAKAYLITLLSPYAGIYYWKNANRVDEVVIKMETSDDEQTTTIIAQGGKEDLERFSTTLKLAERGKVYVKGIFEGEGDAVSN